MGMIKASFDCLYPETDFFCILLSYLVDVSIDKAEDVLLHQKILAEAENPEKRPAFHVRFMKVHFN